MARSRNKYSRAQLRARYRKPRRRGGSTWFYGALTVIIVVGVLGIVFTRSSNNANAVSPRYGINPSTNDFYDHWHEVIGVEICGEWLTDQPEFEFRADNPGVQAGIHTHGDGFIHIHPRVADEGGDHATLGKFASFGGWSVSSDSITGWTGPSFDPNKKTWTNGDKCPGKDGKPGTGLPGHLVWQVDCTNRSGNPADYKLEDQKVLGIGFVTKGEKLGVPLHAASAPQNDGGNNATINPEACRPSAQNNPGVADTSTTTPGATTTAPVSTTAAATTTAPVSTTTKP